jgi:hypothetical protein
MSLRDFLSARPAASIIFAGHVARQSRHFRDVAVTAWRTSLSGEAGMRGVVDRRLQCGIPGSTSLKAGPSTRGTAASSFAV